jgi:hypothetical protein
MPKPMRVLEIGPGRGRSLVFFSKKLGWENSELHAYEGDGKITKYENDGPRFEDSFCGTISELQNVLNFNDIKNVTIHDAKKMAMRELPGPFDLVYGFYTIGFHWSLKHFLDEVLALIGDRGRAIFTVQPYFKPFDELSKRTIFTVIDKEEVCPPENGPSLSFYLRSERRAALFVGEDLAQDSEHRTSERSAPKGDEEAAQRLRKQINNWRKLEVYLYWSRTNADPSLRQKFSKVVFRPRL